LNSTQIHTSTARQAHELEPLGKRWALLCSGVFHPAVLPTLAFACLLWGHIVPMGLSTAAKIWLQCLVAVLTLALPVAMLSFAQFMGLITDWQLRPRAERQFSLWLMAALYGGGTAMVYKYLPTAAYHLLAGVAAMALLVALVDVFYRISGHAMALAAFLGYWGSLAAQSGELSFLPPLLATLLATGVGVWARFTLGAHTVGQLLWGLGVGLLCGAWVGYWPLG